MNLVDKNIKCSGCALCSLVCPKKAINLKLIDGFYRPTIDKQKCIVCGLCVQKCHSMNTTLINSNKFPPKIFACRNKNYDELEKSTSGGMFFLIAEKIIEQGGFVCGAIYSDDYKIVKHIVSNDIEQVKKMRQAKYVQSYVQDAVNEIKDLVDRDKVVLFCGTPCQVYALDKAVSPNRRKNLVLIDIVCHGYPSPMAWYEFVTFLNLKKGNISYFSFRDKEFGWRGVNCVATFKGDSRKYHNSKLISSYSNLYFGHHITAKGCNECKFSTFPRYSSDITIGDFWGIEKTRYTQFNDNKGISLAIINTNKGETIFKAISNKINFQETTFDVCKQPQLLHPSFSSPVADEVMDLIIQNNFLMAIKKYAGYNIFSSLKRLIKKIFHYK